ncbi:hypothetical protein RSAG8_07583, partial [Rhizoctonia solani AG-8 WAC10335]
MSMPSTPSESSPSIVARKVGAGIQARLAKLQGAAGAPVVTREVPGKFPNGYDDPFKEHLDGTLRRSMSGTWSVAGTSLTSDGSHTLVDSTSPSPSVQPVPLEDLKRRQVFTQNWEKEQQAVEKLASPEPSRIANSPQPIIELPEPDDELVPTPTVSQPAPAPTLSKPEPAPEKKDPSHGILTPPISEPEILVQVPVVKEPGPAAVKPKAPKLASRKSQGPAQASSSTAPPAKVPSSSTPAQASGSTTLPKAPKATTSNLLSPRTPIRRPRASAPPSACTQSYNLKPPLSSNSHPSPTRVSSTFSHPRSSRSSTAPNPLSHSRFQTFNPTSTTQHIHDPPGIQFKSSRKGSSSPN